MTIKTSKYQSRVKRRHPSVSWRRDRALLNGLTSHTWPPVFVFCTENTTCIIKYGSTFLYRSPWLGAAAAVTHCYCCRIPHSKVNTLSSILSECCTFMKNGFAPRLRQQHTAKKRAGTRRVTQYKWQIAVDSTKVFFFFFINAGHLFLFPICSAALLPFCRNSPCRLY